MFPPPSPRPATFTGPSVHSLSSPSTAPQSVLEKLPELTATANLQLQPSYAASHNSLTNGRPTVVRPGLQAGERRNIIHHEFAEILKRGIMRLTDSNLVSPLRILSPGNRKKKSQQWSTLHRLQSVQRLHCSGSLPITTLTRVCTASRRDDPVHKDRLN